MSDSVLTNEETLAVYATLAKLITNCDVTSDLTVYDQHSKDFTVEFPKLEQQLYKTRSRKRLQAIINKMKKLAKYKQVIKCGTYTGEVRSIMFYAPRSCSNVDMDGKSHTHNYWIPCHEDFVDPENFAVLLNGLYWVDGKDIKETTNRVIKHILKHLII